MITCNRLTFNFIILEIFLWLARISCRDKHKRCCLGQARPAGVWWRWRYDDNDDVMTMTMCRQWWYVLCFLSYSDIIKIIYCISLPLPSLNVSIVKINNAVFSPSSDMCSYSVWMKMNMCWLKVIVNCIIMWVVFSNNDLIKIKTYVYY